MEEIEVKKTISTIVKKVFDRDEIISINDTLERFAFDIKIPEKVQDSITGEETWTDSINAQMFITLKNMEKMDAKNGWMREKKEIHNLKELIDMWNEINYMTTERVYDSHNVSASDTIYGCQNVYRSTDSTQSKNLVFCDSCHSSEFLLACQRSVTCTFCIRTDDSKNCSNSYSVICSNKISNSLFIQDSFDLYECMFCSHIANKKYCIANMQYTKEEYEKIKEKVIDWILNS